MSAGRRPSAPAAPLRVGAAEASSVLGQIAMIALTASGLAAQAVEEAGADLALVEKVHATQKLIELIGALAESAGGNSVRGSIADWTCGGSGGRT